MPLFYGGPKTPQMWGFIPYDEQKAGEIYVKHYRRYLILNYLARNLDTVQERQGATDEMIHCEKVLARWKLHPNWVEYEVLPSIERLKKLSVYDLMQEYLMFDGSQ